MMRKAMVMVVLGLFAGCGGGVDSVNQGVGGPGGGGGGAVMCSPTLNVTITDGTVYATLGQGFNAWNAGNTTVTFSGSVTDTCGTNDTFSAAVAGSWAPLQGSNAECSNYWSGNATLPAVDPNHWHNVYHCDGSVEVVGCQSDKTVSATVLVNGPGPNDFTGTATVTVPAVQDADVYDVCATECDIGQCVSACQKVCAQGDKACGTCCECKCKWEGRQAGNLACSPQPLCYTGSAGHAACLAP